MFTGANTGNFLFNIPSWNCAKAQTTHSTLHLNHAVLDCTVLHRVTSRAVHNATLLQTVLAALHLLYGHPLLPLAEDPVEGQVGGGVGRHTATRGQLEVGFITDLLSWHNSILCSNAKVCKVERNVIQCTVVQFREVRQHLGCALCAVWG